MINIGYRYLIYSEIILLLMASDRNELTCRIMFYLQLYRQNFVPKRKQYFDSAKRFEDSAQMKNAFMPYRIL